MFGIMMSSAIDMHFLADTFLAVCPGRHLASLCAPNSKVPKSWVCRGSSNHTVCRKSGGLVLERTQHRN